MTCPRCRQQTEVIKTEPSPGGAKVRLRRCRQHGRFWTRAIEKVTEWLDVVSLPATADSLPATENLPLPATANADRTPLPVMGDLGGLAPSGSSISLVSQADQAPSEPQSQTRARVKRITRIDYPEAFEADWRMTAKGGSKDKACDWWERNGRPSFGESWKRWERCAEWQQQWHSFPYVATWLNDGRWKQDPTEARVKNVSTLPPKVEQSRATAVAWAHKVTG